MRAWLYDTLIHDIDLQNHLGYDLAQMTSQVMPRESASVIPSVKPFLIYGLGNETSEDLAEDNDHDASRQFFQIWIHDEGGSFTKIDETIPLIKKLLIGKSDPVSNVSTVRWLENSQEFSNETYNTIFRYSRFQAIISKGASLV